MLRKCLTLAVVASLLIAPVGAVSAQSVGPFSIGDDPSPTVVSYGADGHPSFVVSLTDDSDSVTALQDWADATSSREIIALDNASNSATITAPRWVGTGALMDRVAAVTDNPRSVVDVLGETTLDEQSYVEEISLNYQLQRPEPVAPLIDSSGYEIPQRGLIAANDAEYPTDGMAFSGDANRTAMDTSRDVLGKENVSGDGAGQLIAVVDTGANTAGGSIFGNETASDPTRIHNASKSFISGKSVNTTADDYSAIGDKNGHGTWTASAAAANASGTVHDGLAPNADVLVLKALNAEGSGSTADIAAAIRYAADHDADVISLSLGSQLWSQPIADAVDYAQENGVSAVVVAAGNSRSTRSPGLATPADVSGVITVGATTAADPQSAQSAYFSQAGPDPGTTDNSQLESRGAMVDVAAPGMRTTARVATTDGFVSNSTLSGTSMATPMVAGGITAALSATSSLPSDDPEELETAVQDSARPVPHAAKVEVGHGMFAVDNLVDDTEPSTSQDDAMTDPAQERNVFYTGTSGTFLDNALATRIGV